MVYIINTSRGDTLGRVGRAIFFTMDIENIQSKVEEVISNCPSACCIPYIYPKSIVFFFAFGRSWNRARLARWMPNHGIDVNPTHVHLISSKSIKDVIVSDLAQG